MILHSLIKCRESKKKSLAVLIDPDKIHGKEHLGQLIDICQLVNVDFFFIGGSLVVSDSLSEIVKEIKNQISIPVVLFPGSNLQIDNNADAILFLSLISGRNPEYLIGQHVSAAPRLVHSGIEVIPTGYILVGDDANTTVAYISNTQPIPSNKIDVCTSTALAGEMLGHRLIYLDAGSGAGKEVSPDMIKAVSENISVPLIVGGGINTTDKVRAAYDAGADVVVLGSAVEQDMHFAKKAAEIRNVCNNNIAIHS